MEEQVLDNGLLLSINWRPSGGSPAEACLKLMRREGDRRMIGAYIGAIGIESTVELKHPETKTFFEIVSLMSALGFRYSDNMGAWRAPVTGLLERKETIFVKQGS